MKKISSIVVAIMFFISGSVLFAAKEAPMLAEMVKNGKLPPLNERLPDNPLVEKPVTQIGTYGGKLVLA